MEIRTATWHQLQNWLTHQLLRNGSIVHQFASHSKTKTNAAQWNAGHLDHSHSSTHTLTPQPSRLV